MNSKIAKFMSKLGEKFSRLGNKMPAFLKNNSANITLVVSISGYALSLGAFALGVSSVAVAAPDISGSLALIAAPIISISGFLTGVIAGRMSAYKNYKEIEKISAEVLSPSSSDKASAYDKFEITQLILGGLVLSGGIVALGGLPVLLLSKIAAFSAGGLLLISGSLQAIEATMLEREHKLLMQMKQALLESQISSLESQVTTEKSAQVELEASFKKIIKLISLPSDIIVTDNLLENYLKALKSDLLVDCIRQGKMTLDKMFDLLSNGESIISNLFENDVEKFFVKLQETNELLFKIPMSTLIWTLIADKVLPINMLSSLNVQGLNNLNAINNLQAFEEVITLPFITHHALIIFNTESKQLVLAINAGEMDIVKTFFHSFPSELVELTPTGQPAGTEDTIRQSTQQLGAGVGLFSASLQEEKLFEKPDSSPKMPGS